MSAARWTAVPVAGSVGRWHVVRGSEVRKSASGRDSVFRTWRAANRMARQLNVEAAEDTRFAELANQDEADALRAGQFFDSAVIDWVIVGGILVILAAIVVGASS